MFQVDPLSLIPQSIKEAVLNTMVDLVSEQAQKVLGEEFSGNLKKLRSDAGFRTSFEQGLTRALRRFRVEYEEQDEDLVAAIQAAPDLFKNKEIQDALIKLIKTPGGNLEEERERVAGSFASVFPDRKGRARVDRAVSYLLKCLAEELWSLPEIRPIYELQFQRISAEALRQQTEIQAAQLQALTHLSAGIRESLLQLTQAMVEQKALPSGQVAAAPARRSVCHNLPNRSYGRFIGREKQLREVVRLLHPASRHFVITIDGIGGIGKSTLALEVAHQYLLNFERIPAEERFDAIIWTSAKQTILTGDGIQERPQVLHSLEDIVKAIAITLEREEISKAPAAEQSDLVRAALTRQRVLLIIDNLETVDDERVLSFLRELPAPTKAIVTTRHRIDIAYPIRLKEMSLAEARVYIREEGARRGTVLEGHQVERLYRLTGGVPLAMNWSLALLTKGQPFETVAARLGNIAGSQIAAFCFQSSVDTIRNHPAFRLLLSLAFFNPDGSREALGVTAGLSTLERDDGLAELESLSLVNRTGDRFSFLPLTKSFVISELGKDTGFHLEAGHRWVEWLIRNTQITEQLYDERSPSYQRYQLESPNLMVAVEWAYQYSNADNVLQLTTNVVHYLNIQGLWNEMEAYLERALQLSRSVQKDSFVAIFLTRLARLDSERGDYERALARSLEALDIHDRQSDQRGVFLSLRTLSIAYRKGKDFEKSREMSDRALVIAQELDDSELLMSVYGDYGRLARDQGKWDEAERFFSKVSDWFKNEAEATPRSEDRVRGTWGNLAVVALHSGRPAEAKELCMKSIEYFKGHGIKGYLGTLTYRLALAEEALGEMEAAREHVQEALDIFNSLGMKPDYAEASVLLGRLSS